MHKYIFGILFIFYVLSPGTTYSQERADSSASTGDSVTVQTNSSNVDSSGVTGDAAQTYLTDDSLYMPVRDSSYLNTFKLRQVPMRDVNKYLTDRDYEYANDSAYWAKDRIQNTSPSSFWNFLGNKAFQWILFLLLISALVYGIFMLAKENNFRWFSRRSKQLQGDDPDGQLPDVVNFDKEIIKYQSEGNYRFAIRYLFLRLIRSASERNIIQIRDSMTNSEIGRAFGQHPLASQFRYLAMAYEYVYFGEFNLNKEIFDSLKKKFDLFQEKISA